MTKTQSLRQVLVLLEPLMMVDFGCFIKTFSNTSIHALLITQEMTFLLQELQIKFQTRNGVYQELRCHKTRDLHSCPYSRWIKSSSIPMRSFKMPSPNRKLTLTIKVLLRLLSGIILTSRLKNKIRREMRTTHTLTKVLVLLNPKLVMTKKMMQEISLLQRTLSIQVYSWSFAVKESLWKRRETKIRMMMR